MSKTEILKAIRSCAKKLNRKPTRDDLRRRTKINWDMIRKHFGGMKEAMELAGLEATGSGFPQTEATLLKDWAMVARKLEKLPSVNDYRSTGRFSDGPFFSRYGRWTRVPETFRRFAGRAKLEAEWADVLAMIRTRTKGESPAEPSRFSGTRFHGDTIGGSKRRGPKFGEPGLRGPRRKQDIFQYRPLYGPLMNLPEMVHEPLNELGVVFAFGLVARQLGFSVLRFQSAFPDCEALREVVKGQLQRMKLEFEFESRNFLRHGHRIDGCDGIVCWKHNWKECPLEVIELRKVFHRLIGTSGNREIEEQKLLPQRTQREEEDRRDRVIG
jgi:hypothetical protein